MDRTAGSPGEAVNCRGGGSPSPSRAVARATACRAWRRRRRRVPAAGGERGSHPRWRHSCNGGAAATVVGFPQDPVARGLRQALDEVSGGDAQDGECLQPRRAHRADQVERRVVRREIRMKVDVGNDRVDQHAVAARIGADDAGVAPRRQEDGELARIEVEALAAPGDRRGRGRRMGEGGGRAAASVRQGQLGERIGRLADRAGTDGLQERRLRARPAEGQGRRSLVLAGAWAPSCASGNFRFRHAVETGHGRQPGPPPSRLISNRFTPQGGRSRNRPGPDISAPVRS